MAAFRIVTGNRRFRKSVLRRARKGLHAMRLMGGKGSWTLCALRGKGIVPVKGGFTTSTEAKQWAEVQCGQEPTIYKPSRKAVA